MMDTPTERQIPSFPPLPVEPAIRVSPRFSKPLEIQLSISRNRPIEHFPIDYAEVVFNDFRRDDERSTDGHQA